MGCWRYLLILLSVRSTVSGIRQFGLVFIVASCIVVLQACAVAPERSALAEVENDQASAQLSDELNDSSEGDMALFSTGKLAKLGTVTIGKQYDAASGRSCKQILDASGVQLLSVACQLPTEQWYVRESLNVAGNAIQAAPANTKFKNVLVQAELPTVELKPTVKNIPKPISYKLDKDETLYSFARRMTGDASNWEAIAKYNGITDELSLPVGAALRIPTALQTAKE